MAKPAKPQGKKPVDKMKPTPNTRGRQSQGPSLPTGRPPAGAGQPTGGGTSPQTSWGRHLQGN